MSKSVTFKEALKKWESRKGIKGAEAKEVKLNGNSPPIAMLDPSLSLLVNCEKLSLSTNFVEKLNNLNGLKNLKCLSLGRNWIKSLYGLEVLGETLEELWISYNAIEKMKGIGSLSKLRVLYMSNNLVREWPEFLKLNELTQLEDLNFVGNPIEEKHSASGDWREKVTDAVPSLKRLDGYPVIKKEVDVERSSSICGTLT